jgi:hypothetical protein
VFPERIDWKPIRTTGHQTDRHNVSNTNKEGMANEYEKGGLGFRRWRNEPVGINSSEPFPALNQSGLPSPER